MYSFLSSLARITVVCVVASMVMGGCGGGGGGGGGTPEVTPAPVASFVANPAPGNPMTWNFQSTSTGAISSWSWDFGDGGQESGAVTIHAYTNAGPYLVTLTVEGDGGNDSQTMTITVSSGGPAPGVVGDECSNPIPAQEGSNPIDTTVMTTGADPTTGCSGSYGNDAWYSFTPTGSGSMSVSSCNSVNFDNVISVYQGGCASLSGNLLGCDDDSCGTSAVVSGIDVTNGTEYLIRVGGWSSSEAGTGTLNISVSGGGGPIPAPEASFIALATNFDLQWSFNDTSTGQINSWNWNFGDGESSTAQSPGHVFPSPDTYTVSLIVSGPGGSSSASETITVGGGPQPVTPAAPSNLTGSALSGTEVGLTWNDNSSNETGFLIQFCLGSGCSNFTDVGTLIPNSTLVTINNLPPGSTHRFRVLALGSGGVQSNPSNVVEVTTQSGATEQLYSPQFNNLVLYNTADPATGNTYYGGCNFPGDTLVGCIFDYGPVCGPLGCPIQLIGTICARSLLYYPVNSDIAGRTILEAKLILNPINIPVDDGQDYRVNAIGVNWDPSTVTGTWAQNNLQWYVGAAADFPPPISPALTQEINITQIVQNWANGSFSNFGLVLQDPTPIPPGNISLQAAGYGCQPQLYIRYQ